MNLRGQELHERLRRVERARGFGGGDRDRLPVHDEAVPFGAERTLESAIQPEDDLMAAATDRDRKAGRRFDRARESPSHREQRTVGDDRRLPIQPVLGVEWIRADGHRHRSWDDRNRTHGECRPRVGDKPALTAAGSGGERQEEQWGTKAHGSRTVGVNRRLSVRRANVQPPPLAEWPVTLAY
jgi:hypothetical protein